MHIKFIKNINDLQRVWWVIYVFLIPIFISQIPTEFTRVAYDREKLVMIVVAGGLLLEILSRPALRFSDIQYIPRNMKAHPSIFWVLMFTIWGFLNILFTSEPIIALTGSLREGGDGAIWYAILGLSFILLYIRLISDFIFVRWITFSLILSGVFIGAFGLAEYFLQRPFFMPVETDSLPILMYPQKGHLAIVISLLLGIFVWTFEVKFSFFLKTVLLLSIVILSFCLGLTLNRTAYLSIVPIFLLSFFYRQKLPTVILSAVFIFFGYQVTFLNASSKAKVVESTATLETRLLMIKAGISGIFQKPILGWGAGEFQMSWPDYLDKNDLSRFMKLEFGKKYISHNKTSFVIQQDFEVGGIKQTKGLYTITAWKVHNQFIEIAILRGIPGLLMYLVLLWLVMRRINPWSIGIIAIHTVLLMWFLTWQSDGIFWVVMALAAATTQLEVNKKHLDPHLVSSIAPQNT
jgi:O-antigen ligase